VGSDDLQAGREPHAVTGEIEVGDHVEIGPGHLQLADRCIDELGDYVRPQPNAAMNLQNPPDAASIGQSEQGTGGTVWVYCC
jgi:hypothetical protein